VSILITGDTTCIIQGITGREAVSMTRECLDYGTKIVGGVTPVAAVATSTVCRSSTPSSRS